MRMVRLVVLALALVASLGSGGSSSSRPAPPPQQQAGNLAPQVGPWWCSTTSKQLTLTFCMRNQNLCEGTMANMRQKGYQTTPCAAAPVSFCFVDPGGQEMCMSSGYECLQMQQAMWSDQGAAPAGTQCVQINAQ
jgi:hypothetical protein